MKMHFDEQADAVYLRLDDSKIIESEEAQPGVILDFNAQHQVVGIEILKVKERIPLSSFVGWARLMCPPV